MAKVFISHSSVDKDTIDFFKNIILNNGLGVVDSDIAYTSAVETGVPIGKSIPDYIKSNLAECDFVFFMISDNYRKSEVCLNEMGAAWALGKEVIPILIDNIGFDSVGWLYQVNLCAKLNDEERLDEIRDLFVAKYGLQKTTAVWNRQKLTFIQQIAGRFNVNNSLIPAIPDAVIISEPEELGFLDYRIKFDDSQAELLMVINNMTAKQNEFTERLSKKSDQISAISQSGVASPRQLLSIMREISNMMEKMALYFNEFSPQMEILFNQSIEYSTLLCNVSEEAVTEDNIDSFKNLLDSIKGTKGAFVQQRGSVESLPNIQGDVNRAKRKYIQSLNNLIDTFDRCILRTTEFILKFEKN